MDGRSPRSTQLDLHPSLVYPPGWYLNIIRSRLCKALGETSGGLGIPEGNDAGIPAFCMDDMTHIRVLALVLEVVRPYFCLNGRSLYNQAYLLGLDIPEVRGHVKLLFEAASTVDSAETLIIEDEAAVTLDLMRVVRQTGHRVCGTAARLDQAVEMAERTRPGLVLADVQLGDDAEAGIMAVREIWRSGEVPVVYVTAYPERVTQGASDALVIEKPFAAREIQTAMWRALYRQGTQAVAPA